MVVKMKKYLTFILLLTSIEAFESYNLTVGPKKTETGRFLYHGTYGLNHCRICPMEALMDSTFSYLQQPLCNNNYNIISEEVTQYEKDNKSYALCGRGDIPGCRSFPNDTKTKTMDWYCDSGYSLQRFSVYFSCALICKLNNKVLRSYYCSEQLEWQLDYEGSSQQNCQAPGKAPEENPLVLIVVVIGIIVAVGAVIVIVVCLLCKRSRKLKQWKVPRRSEDTNESVPLTEVGTQSLDAVERGDDVAGGMNQENPVPPDHLGISISSSSSNSHSSSSHPEQGSLNTEQEQRTFSSVRTNNPAAKPNIKIMICKNDSSQISVPIQMGYYSIEIGSDYFVIPDCPGGISVAEFHVGCKKNGMSFRGKKCNPFMYEVSNVCEEDDGFYTWMIQLENGTEHHGLFQIYVPQPELSTENRRGPYGEENITPIGNSSIASLNNQQVRAEVHAGLPGYVPLSNDLFSTNHPGLRHDSGFSLSSRNSSAHNNVNHARNEDVMYSTSGYETQPSIERDMDGIDELLGTPQRLNIDSLRGVSSTRSFQGDSASDSINDCQERPMPAGCTTECRNLEEVYHDAETDDEDDFDQTDRKHPYTNESDGCSSSINMNTDPHGEIESTGPVRPMIPSIQGSLITNTSPVEEFHDRVSKALQKMPTLPAETSDFNPVETGESDHTEICQSNPIATGGSSTTEGGESSPTARGESSPTERGGSSPTATGESSPTARGESSPTARGEFSLTARGESSLTARGESSPTERSGSNQIGYSNHEGNETIPTGISDSYIQNNDLNPTEMSDSNSTRRRGQSSC